VGVDDGKIVATGSDSTLPSADETVDAKGLLVMPGAIDPHVHMGIFNALEDDIRDTTMVQAIGGVTTSFEMKPDKRSYKESIPELTRAIDKNAHIDVTLYMTVMTQQHIDELPYAVAQGVTSFKHFWNKPEYEFLGIYYLDRGQIHSSYQKIKELGGVAMNHCEDFEISKTLTERVRSSGAKDLAAWNDSRPDYCEQVMIWQAAYAAKMTGCPTYIVHTTVGTAKEVVDWARANHVTMYWETTPSYLHFVKSDRKIGVLGKVNPPIRTQGHVDALWDGVKSGWIDCIGTDHCSLPSSRKLPKGDKSDIWETELAFPGSEMMLPFMISEAYNKRGVPIERVAELTSTNVARIHGLVNKGAISVGFDADIVIVDPKREVKVSDKILHYSRVRDFSLWEGEVMTGYPIMTICRGSIVARDGEIVGKPGYGKTVKHVPSNRTRNPTLSELVN
jgi:dihydropyrimidinase